MNKQSNTKQTRSERLDMRVSAEEKTLIKKYCKENNTNITNLILTAISNEMKQNSLETRIQEQLPANTFYNYAVAYSTKSRAVKTMLKEYKKGEVTHA